MSSSFILLLIGLLYILFLGGLSITRREGLSTQFALEAIGFTILMSGLAYYTSIEISPVLFLIVIYLLTMRIRLLVDIGNAFARRENYQASGKFYALALKLFPDPANRLMVLINQAVAQIKQGEVDGGIQRIDHILGQKDSGCLGIKTETACYYNLAIAYRRKGQEKKAVDYFRKVVDTYPMSIYGRRAMLELKKNKPDAADDSRQE